MVGIRDLVGTDFAPVSNKTAVNNEAVTKSNNNEPFDGTTLRRKDLTWNRHNF